MFRRRDRRQVHYNLRRKPEKTRKRIFERSGLHDVESLGVPKWARKYMKLDMKHVLFTNEWRAILDGPENWGKGWVLKGDKNILCFDGNKAVEA